MLCRLIHDELAPNFGLLMLKKLASAAVHLVFFAGVMAIAALLDHSHFHAGVHRSPAAAAATAAT